MENPLVSVVIPVFNSEKYIVDCITSVINQDYKNIEILIINDGSTDESSDKIATVQDARIKVYNKENKGISDTRNFGILNATGKYIYFIDSDDWIQPNLISSSVTAIEKENSDIVFFNFYVDTYSLAGDLQHTSTSALSGIKDKDSDILKVVGYCWNKLYKRSFLMNNNLLFKESLSLYEDVDFNLLCFSSTNAISFVSGTFYHYNNRMIGSLVKSYNPDMNKYSAIVLATLKNFLASKNYSKEQRTEIVNDFAMVSIRHQLNSLFKFSETRFGKRTKLIRSICDSIEDIDSLKNKTSSDLKELIIMKLIAYKKAFFLNLLLTLKK